MCGIAGYSGLSADTGRPLLSKMATALTARGPDDTGFLAERSIGLAHTRLSIIDISGGHQPIFNEDRTIAIILNGEIYNFKDLRNKLTASGHKFCSQSDTEVLLHLYEEEGKEFLKKVDGMFSIAIASIS